MDYTEIVGKLIGEINPVGETYEDNRRYENQNEIIELVANLIEKLASNAKLSTRHEYSISRAGKRALSFLTGLRRDLEEVIESSE